MTALVTNVITDILYAVVLFFCFVGAAFHYLKREGQFNVYFLFYFLTAFLIAVLGSIAHAVIFEIHFKFIVWFFIAIFSLLSNYLLIFAIAIPVVVRVIVLAVSILLTFLFIAVNQNFYFLALSLMVAYIVAACYSTRKLRLGFLMVLFSNVIWVVSRFVLGFWFGSPVPLIYRYDNDIYHVLLIFAALLIYWAVIPAKAGTHS